MKMHYVRHMTQRCRLVDWAEEQCMMGILKQRDEKVPLDNFFLMN